MLSVVSADYGGGYAGSGFRYGSNAREFSLAGALVADKIPGFYAFSNPSLLHLSRDNHIGISYQKMSLDRSIQSVSFTRRLPPNAGVGLSYLRAGTDNIMGRDRMNNKTISFSSSEIEWIISFGVAFGSKFALGINIKAFFPSIAPEIIDVQSGRGIGWDVGFIYKLHRHLILGGVFENLSSRYNWKMTKDGEPDSYEDFFPQTIKLGIYYTALRNISICFQEDIVSIPGNNINYRSRLGVEYRLTNNVKLRGGLVQALGSVTSDEKINDINLKPSFGAGIPIKAWKKQSLQMDYALDLGSVGEGLSHLFSFSMKIK